MYGLLRLTLLLAAISAFPQLTGCALVAGAGLASGAIASTDRRTTGTFIDDEIIEFKVLDAITKRVAVSEQSHINATSFNNVVLLTGETPSAAFKTQIAQVASSVEKVRSVHDEIAIAAPSSLLARTSDTWVTSKVKTILLNEMQMGGTRVKVVTEKGVVYLMGLVSSAEADKATELARRVGGVERVVRLFEIS